ncbi:DNA sulfur modification protein DndB [Clostridium perfringens]|uniref:DNA sulfur modification protein DndB n=1 Tax=Clostridium perfringens TaxID=1502 RepID=UPI0030CB3287
MNNYKTSNYFEKNKEINSYSTIIEKNDSYYLKVMIFMQSSRVVYRSVLSFWDVEKLCKHTDIRPKDDKQVLMDLNNIKNRYLDSKHGEEIVFYVKDNVDDFILPNITTVIDTPLQVVYDLNSNEDVNIDIFKALKENNGCITGLLKLDKNVNFSIADGNHRTYSIHKLVERKLISGDIEGLYIGVDFYLETDKEKEKSIFVNLNTTKPIDSSVMSLLKENDLIAYSVKSLLGINQNYKYVVEHFYPQNDKYIGVDLVNDSVSKSNNTVSFNMIKNIISLLSFGKLNADKKFEEAYGSNKLEYMKFMKRISEFLNYIFDNCEPFNKIDIRKANIKKLREEYISMTGAGLYIIAGIGHMAIKYDGIDIIEVAKVLCTLDWKRELLDENNENKIANPLFVGGILNKDGKISNNRTAIRGTIERIKREINLMDEDIKKILDEQVQLTLY